MITEFTAGVRTLLQGFSLWRTRPKLMILGMIPAVIAILIIVGLLLPLVLGMPVVSAWLTPFAEEWPTPWRDLVRGAVGIVVVVAAVALASAVFSALTLTIGDPFYQRIWHAVETDLGDAPSSDGGGFWTTIAEGLRLVVLGVLIALLVLVSGFVPLIGSILGATVGIVLSGRLLARELTGRAFDARDFSPADRAALFRGSRARVLGFGVATQLCYLIPGGAVMVMPAAVAGSTMLARTMMERAASTPAPSRTGSAPAPLPPPQGSRPI